VAERGGCGGIVAERGGRAGGARWQQGAVV
jgi:hypothetical protein